MAASEDNTEILPLLSDDVPHFDLAMRGYDKRQVDEYLVRAEADIAVLQSARDTALAASADRAAQLASREAQIESLTRQQAANAAPTVATVSASVRADAAAEEQRLISAAVQRSAEADQKLAQARLQASVDTDAARSAIAAQTAEADAARLRLDVEASAARESADRLSAERIAVAEQDFEITQRLRRTAAEQTHQAELAASRAQAEAMIAQAAARVELLESQRQDVHEHLRSLHAALGAVIATELEEPSAATSDAGSA
jgi:DivIVA domain-containing protein